MAVPKSKFCSSYSRDGLIENTIILEKRYMNVETYKMARNVPNHASRLNLLSLTVQ